MSRKMNIGLFMCILENDFSYAVLEGALKGARENDANLIVFPMDLINGTYAEESVNRFRYQYNTLASHMDSVSLDGVVIEYGTIVSTISNENKTKFLSFIKDKPTILLSEERDGYASVVVDNETGLRDLILHLINDHKYKKIAFLSGTKGNRDGELRLNVYKNVMREHGLYCESDYIIDGNFSEYVEDEVTEFIKTNPDVEAIVCANDAMVIGASSAMRKMGLEPGKDIYLTGFDDIVAGFLHDPMISTVNADPMELSRFAVDMICKGQYERKNFRLDTKMIIRESCGCQACSSDDKWRNHLNFSNDWRRNAQSQYFAEQSRRGFEHELSNITRELVFDENTEVGRYDLILNTFKRLVFKSCKILLYDKPIFHTKNEVWNNPEYINIVGYYCDINGSNHVFPIGKNRILTNNIFDDELLSDGNRHEVVVIPLFFGESQIGLLLAESDADRFLFAYDMGGQISNILHIVDMNEKQKKMTDELEEASRLKSRFLANMSHEIRTPINAIMGFNEMILRENKDINIGEYATDVKQAADSLLLLVNDILDFSKIEAGKMDIVLGEYSLNNLLDTCINMMTSRAEKKGLALFLEYKKDLPDNLLGDFGRIQQILLNLLSNAIKYTEKGTVKLKVNGIVKDDNVEISFSVIDTGSGIKKKDFKRLFNEFDRIDEKKNRNIEGTGLGLNIIAGLLKLMNSELLVSSDYGVGSEFSFTLVQEIVKKARKNLNNDNSNDIKDFTAPKARVLVVDDNALNRKVICSLLKNTEMIIDQAESGFECIDMVSDYCYDIVLLDHMMPDLDGIETLNKMKKMNIIDLNKTSVISLTANAIVGAKEMYFENGFTDYLSKPVRPSDLNEMLLKYISPEKVIRK